jgi:drug/metabolite transporter (DMT)-like permease
MNKIPLHYKGLILISTAALLWSTGGLFIKILTIEKLTPFQITFFRSLIAALTLFFIIKFKNREKIKIEFDLISILCAVSYSGILIFFVVATTLTTVANTIFLQFTAPVYLLFLEPFFLKTKFKVNNLFAVLFSVFGMSLFFIDKIETGNHLGNMFGIFSGICFAFFSLFLKWKKQLHKTENTLNQILLGNILIALISLPLVFDKLILSGTGYLILIFLGVFQIGISYAIYNEGIKYVSATESLIIAMLEAVFNPFWVFLGIGEKPGFWAMVGGIIILATIAVKNIFSGKRRIEQN